MKFEALNFKKKFKICKIVCLLGLIFVLINGIPPLEGIPMPSWNPTLADLANIDSYNSKYQTATVLAKIAPVFVLSAGIVLASLAVMFHKWEKEAKKYGLCIEGTKVHILCEGQTICLDSGDIDRFEILPKNCEPQIKAKWSEVGYIVSGGQAYKLYYLSKLQEAKILIEASKAHQ